MAEDDPVSDQVQRAFNQKMEALKIPLGFSESDLNKLLHVVSQELGVKIGYHLSGDDLNDLTRFTYQSQSNPRKDRLISRIFPVTDT